MPRVEHFLPKKEDIGGNGQGGGHVNPRRNTFLEAGRDKSNESPKNPPAKMVFRRQKYSKA